MEIPRVVIVGGGFAGIAAARTLAKTGAQITIVDRNNHHLFQPLLYQVATAGLTPSNIAYPIRSIMHKDKNVLTLMAEVTAIEADKNELVLDGKEKLGYDFLVLASGATHSYFGHEAWAAKAPGLKTIEDATEIRRRILIAFEKAERETNSELRSSHLTFVIIGAGPTGVELAGAIAELSRRSFSKDFRNIDSTLARVILIEAGDRILASFSAELSKRAELALTKLGVEIKLNHRVVDINDDRVICENTSIRTSTVIWAAGVQASALGRMVTDRCDNAGRVEVLPDLSIAGYRNIFIAGDLARVETQPQKDGVHLPRKLVPGVAPAATQGGRHVGKNIARILAKKETLPFRYFDKGQLATIGRNAAIAEFGNLKVSGYLAWLTWVAVHIFFLIDFRNRLMVMIDWILAYITFHKGSRLITGKPATNIGPDSSKTK